MKADQLQVHTLLKDTISLLCKNGLNFQTAVRIEGVIGITIDNTDIFLVHINETFSKLADESLLSSSNGAVTSDDSAGVETGKLARKLFKPCQKHFSLAKRPVQNTNVSDVEEVSLAESFQQSSAASQSSNYLQLATSYPTEQADNSAIVRKKIKEEEATENDDVVYVKPEDVSQEMSYPSQYVKSSWGDMVVSDPGVCQYSSLGHDDDLNSNLSETGQPPLTDFRAGLSGSPEHDRKSQLSAPEGEMSYNDNSYDYAACDYNDDNGDDEMENRMDNSSAQWSSYWDGTSHVSQSHHDISRQQKQLKKKSLSTTKFGNPCHSQRSSHQKESASWGTMMITKFVCKVCGSAFNHRPSLLAHQINKHGRKKNKRGRPKNRTEDN